MTHLCELYVMVIKLLLHDLLQYSEHKYLGFLEGHLLHVLMRIQDVNE